MEVDYFKGLVIKPFGLSLSSCPLTTTQTAKVYSVSQKKSPLRFCEIFSQMVGDF